MKRLRGFLKGLKDSVEASVFVEYLLLLTMVGIGVIAGLAALKLSLLNELNDLLNTITSP